MRNSRAHCVQEKTISPLFSSRTGAASVVLTGSGDETVAAGGGVGSAATAMGGAGGSDAGVETAGGVSCGASIGADGGGVAAGAGAGAATPAAGFKGHGFLHLGQLIFRMILKAVSFTLKVALQWGHATGTRFPVVLIIILSSIRATTKLRWFCAIGLHQYIAVSRQAFNHLSDERHGEGDAREFPIPAGKTPLRSGRRKSLLQENVDPIKADL